MKTLGIATLLVFASVATSDAGCGVIVPAVPVITYYGVPVVAYEPGYHSSAGPYGYEGRGVRPPLVTTRVYYPGQPVRNALRVLAP